MSRTLLFSLLFLLTLGTLAWYLHASIYWSLGKANIHQPPMKTVYVVGNASAPELRYTALGDSLTAGVGVANYQESYPYVLAKKIAGTSKKVVLTPLAVPGIRSSYVLNNFLEPTIQSKPDIITLLIGINDIHGNVSGQQFQENYTQILERLTKETHAKIYIINLPYIGTAHLVSLPYRYYFDMRTQQYNGILQQLATHYNVTYIDLYTAHEPYALQDTLYANDFFHPNALGYALWAQYLYANSTP